MRTKTVLLAAALILGSTSLAVAADEAPAAALKLPDWGTVVTPAAVSAGKDATRACQGCHTFESDGHSLEGPNLFGVVGRQPGGNPAYRYSQGMSDFGGKHDAWTADLLYQFLDNPGQFVPGTKMSFMGVQDVQTRTNIIAYLHSLSPDVPVPAPDPSRQAAPK